MNELSNPMTRPTPDPSPPDAPAKPRRTLDMGEVMVKCDRMLADLTPGQRRRVLAWLVGKWAEEGEMRKEGD